MVTSLATANGVVDLAVHGAEWTPAQIDVIKRTVAKDASNEELALFLYLAKRYELDPFKREIWFIKYKKRDGSASEPVIMTARDGYLAIAQRHPDYLGITSFAVRESDTFEVDAATNTVHHKFGAKRGNLIGAWAMVKRRGRDPVVAYADLAEYRGQSEPWTKTPSAMIIKVAETFALKRQFGISGLVTREELNERESDEEHPALSARVVEATTSESTAQQPTRLPKTDQDAVWQRIRARIEFDGLDLSAFKEWAKDAYLPTTGKRAWGDLTPEEWQDFEQAADEWAPEGDDSEDGDIVIPEPPERPSLVAVLQVLRQAGITELYATRFIQAWVGELGYQRIDDMTPEAWGQLWRAAHTGEQPGAVALPDDKLPF